MAAGKPKRGASHEVAVGGFAVSARARRYAGQVLDSGRLSYGPFHRRFESAFAKEHDSRHAVFCNSGTSALHIAVQALKEKHGWADAEIEAKITRRTRAIMPVHLLDLPADMDPIAAIAKKRKLSIVEQFRAFFRR